MRRELWETLVDLMTSINPEDAAYYGLHVNDVVIDLPVEVYIRHTDVGFRLMVDLPQWRWQGGYELKPGRLTVRLQESNYDEL